MYGSIPPPGLEPQISRFGVRGVKHSATHASTEFVKEVINYYYYIIVVSIINIIIIIIIIIIIMIFQRKF